MPESRGLVEERLALVDQLVGHAGRDGLATERGPLEQTDDGGSCPLTRTFVEPERRIELLTCALRDRVG